ncbi:hypothetical protein BJF78_03915 [Pseudonocardia sp. CNS-139]|nr:hypothetical protein BJF78_03915 [Pseudonocardia sp. CNS-139]
MLAAALAGSVTVAVAGQVWLQATFATVRHPVALGVANAATDAPVVRGWLEVLLAQGTLDRMVATELVDLVWVVGVMASVVLLTLLAARHLETRAPRVARVLRRVAPWTALAPGLDLLENGLSLALLADPLGFPPVLAVAHGTVGTVKLAAMVAVGVVVPGLWLLAWTWSARRGHTKAGRGPGRE